MATVEIRRHDLQIVELERSEIEFRLEQVLEAYRPSGETWSVKHFRQADGALWRLEFRRNGGQCRALTIKPTDWFLDTLEPYVAIFLKGHWPLRPVM